MARTLTLFQNNDNNEDSCRTTKKSLPLQKQKTGSSSNRFLSHEAKKSISPLGFAKKLRLTLSRAVIRTSPLRHTRNQEEEENSQRQTFDSQTTNSTTTNENNSLVFKIGTGGFASNHIMVNMTRRKHGLSTLYRIPRLDEIARAHAKKMAQFKKLTQSSKTYDELKEKVRDAITKTTNSNMMDDNNDDIVVGENIQRGQNIQKMHRLCVNDEYLFENIVHVAYTKMGMGTAKSDDGLLYMCQVFSS